VSYQRVASPAMTGTDGDDVILGTEGDDMISGLAGDDSLTGAGGNDLIDGGSGMDTATWGGSAGAYALGFGSAGWTVQALSGLEGTDTLSNIERIQFSNKTIHIDTEASASMPSVPDALYQFFITAFDAAPGITYLRQLSDAYESGMSVQEIVSVFTTKPQFLALYPEDMSQQAFAGALVTRVVGTSASASARETAAGDIKAALDIGMSRAEIIYTVFGNLARMPATDLNWAKTAKLFSNQIAVAKTYTEEMHQSTTDLETLRMVLWAVEADSPVQTEEARIALVIAGLMSEEDKTAPIAGSQLTRAGDEPEAWVEREWERWEGWPWWGVTF